VPEPRRVEPAGGEVRLPAEWLLDLGPGVAKNDVAVEALEEELLSRFGMKRGNAAGLPIRLAIAPGSVKPGPTADRDTDAIAAQTYRLDISESGIVAQANAPPGLFYAVETLAQLARIRTGGVYVPKATITDWPDLHLRHMYWDDAHHLERLPELKRAVREAALFKINGFALKLEGHFKFPSAPAVVEPYALTPAEYQELTDYGLRYHVQVIPYLDGPAHIAFILKHPEYAKYRSFPDSNYELCATNPEAVGFLSGMFQDLIDANRGGKFVYLSTDEAYYIGLADNAQCREKAAAEAKDSVGKLLAEFVATVANRMHEQGRTVIFWGEYPLKTGDIASLPAHLVNGEVYGPEFDALYKKHGIKQMIYTSTQGGEARFFPDYFALPNALRLHAVASQVDRLRDGFRTISYSPAREHSELIGANVAGWGDIGLHPETFWLGYATITAAAWNPGTPAVEESAAEFYRVFHGEGAVNMSRVYQLMSQQSHFWLDSWEWGPGSRKPIWGNSEGVFNPRRPVKDQMLPLPGADPQGWLRDNQRRIELAQTFLAQNDELVGLLNENLGRVERNRYSLELYLAIAHLYRQNLEMIVDIGRICSLLSRANMGNYDRALELAQQIRQQRNVAYRNAVTTYEKTWFPRVRQANGRTFLHELDDVKDHVGDRTIDLTYMIERELQLPFGQWVETIRETRNKEAAVAGGKPDTRVFDWADMSDRPVVGGIPEE
jgi:hypothetical protein